MSEDHLNVQFGCGLCAPIDWVNFDSSPTLILERIPLLGRFFPSGQFPLFPANVRRANICLGLPIKDDSAELVYCSHALEHMTRTECSQALTETFRIMHSGGAFRLVLPDLNYYITDYLKSSSEHRASDFMRATMLGCETRDRTIRSLARQLWGGSQHLWMWDYEGMRDELHRVGFINVRRASFGDSQHPAFRSVEDVSRWDNALGMEATKP